MNKQDKELLFKDLCARLPYGVKIYVKGHDATQVIEGILHLNPNVSFRTEDCYSVYLTDIKPYLRPMSSMTEEERKELEELTGGDEISISGFGIRVLYGGCYGMMWDDCSEIVDWLNAHYFDYRGLIEKGLALEAPKDMYEN